ncbi:uncharacterized protein LOC129222277 [Uloborus diversus]|uniref:uncharacterized protein LOC129222277 n=1 Tax=Uloborus diversus TaxID=327109 RepID=UPI00240A0900|nr:uncharacterized protein LOC129222277 [Uloborus diversus]
MQKVSGMKCAGRKKPSKGNSLEPDNEKQMHDKTHLISCNLQSNRKKNSSCQETDMNQRSKRSKNVQYQVFFSSDSDTDTSVSTPPSTTKPRRFSTSKSKRVTVIHKPRVTPKSNSSNCSKQELGRSFLEADTEMKAVGNFKTTDSSFLPDTALSLNKNSSQEPDQDTYDFDSSNPKMKRVFAENCGNAMLGIKSDASVSDKKLNSKKFFPSKQNHKKDVSVTNIADSFPRSHSENDKNLEKCNSNWTKPNTIEEANVSSDSVDSERELNPLERKRVSFATLDSVYKFQRNSAVIYCDKRKTVQCTKNNVSSDSEESSASELDGEKPVTKGKEGKVLSLPEGIKKGQHTVKKATNESAKNHVMQSKELGQCLKDKTLEVDPHSLMHYVATNGEMDLDDETEIYTFVPSEQQEVEKTDSADCNASMITMHRR